MRASLDAATQDHDASAALRMVNALAWYWFVRGRLTEARRALDEALALGRAGHHGDVVEEADWRQGADLGGARLSRRPACLRATAGSRAACSALAAMPRSTGPQEAALE